MAVSASQARSTAALARARARMPGLLPDTVEVVEPSRGEVFVVVHTRPVGLVVLDGAGRLVRGRGRLAAIAAHRSASLALGRALREAFVGQRLEHARRSVALLADARARLGGQRALPVAALERALGRLELALHELAAAERRQAERPPTERTLRRTITLLNDAAGADRDVVRVARALAVLLPGETGRPSARTNAATTIHRWIVARLASPDLRFFLPELERGEARETVRAFVDAARLLRVPPASSGGSRYPV